MTMKPGRDVSRLVENYGSVANPGLPVAHGIWKQDFPFHHSLHD